MEWFCKIGCHFLTVWKIYSPSANLNYMQQSILQKPYRIDSNWVSLVYSDYMFYNEYYLLNVDTIWTDSSQPIANYYLEAPWSFILLPASNCYLQLISHMNQYTIYLWYYWLKLLASFYVLWIVGFQ
jgi:hypothetical protein